MIAYDEDGNERVNFLAGEFREVLRFAGCIGAVGLLAMGCVHAMAWAGWLS